MTMEIADKIKFWENMAQEDFEFAQKLYQDKKYLWSLFIAQLALEKALKARVIEKTGKEAPKIHDLVRLAQIVDWHLSKEQEKELEIITGFNIEARYTDYKEGLKKVADQEYTKEYITKSEEYLQWFLKKS